MAYFYKEKRWLCVVSKKINFMDYYIDNENRYQYNKCYEKESQELRSDEDCGVLFLPDRAGALKICGSGSDGGYFSNVSLVSSRGLGHVPIVILLYFGEHDRSGTVSVFQAYEYPYAGFT